MSYVIVGYKPKERKQVYLAISSEMVGGTVRINLWWTCSPHMAEKFDDLSKAEPFLPFLRKNLHDEAVDPMSIAMRENLS